MDYMIKSKRRSAKTKGQLKSFQKLKAKTTKNS